MCCIIIVNFAVCCRVSTVLRFQRCRVGGEVHVAILRCLFPMCWWWWVHALSVSRACEMLPRAMHSSKGGHVLPIIVVYAESEPRRDDKRRAGQPSSKCSAIIIIRINNTLIVCTIVAACQSYCGTKPQPWKEKCTWLTCGDCRECRGKFLFCFLVELSSCRYSSFVFLTTIVAECHQYCDVKPNPWEEKCTWLTCSGCSQCFGESSPIEPPIFVIGVIWSPRWYLALLSIFDSS